MTRNHLNLLSKASLMFLLSGALACNITDPDANPDGGPWLVGEDAGGGGGGEDTGGGGDDVGDDTGAPDTGGCADSERNECGGCEALDVQIGSACPGGSCGVVACDGTDRTRCDCAGSENCQPVPGQATCACAPFYVLNAAGACVDIDECEQDVCDPRTTCTNTEGGFTCSPCPAGTLDSNGDGTLCTPAIEDVEYVAKEEIHPGNTSTCIEVACPAGKSALSGGHINRADIFINASRPANNGQSWLICGFSEERAEWTVTATCATTNVDLIPAQEVQSIAPSSGACVDALCPDGTRAVGGGGGWPDTFRPDHSRPRNEGDGWTICGLSGRGGDEISVFAVCADVATTVRVNRQDDLPSEACVEQGCEGTEALIGGGGYWDLNRVLTQNAIRTTGTPSQQVCGKNAEPQEAWAVAICAPQL